VPGFHDARRLWESRLSCPERGNRRNRSLSVGEKGRPSKIPERPESSRLSSQGGVFVIHKARFFLQPLPHVAPLFLVPCPSREETAWGLAQPGRGPVPRHHGMRAGRGLRRRGGTHPLREPAWVEMFGGHGSRPLRGPPFRSFVHPDSLANTMPGPRPSSDGRAPPPAGEKDAAPRRHRLRRRNDFGTDRLERKTGGRPLLPQHRGAPRPGGSPPAGAENGGVGRLAGVSPTTSTRSSGRSCSTSTASSKTGRPPNIRRTISGRWRDRSCARRIWCGNSSSSGRRWRLRMAACTLPQQVRAVAERLQPLLRQPDRPPLRRRDGDPPCDGRPRPDRMDADPSGAQRPRRDAERGTLTFSTEHRRVYEVVPEIMRRRRGIHPPVRRRYRDGSERGDEQRMFDPFSRRSRWARGRG